MYKCWLPLQEEQIISNAKMEDQTLNPHLSSCDHERLLEIARSKRDVPPAHYTLKIESFSQLCEILKKTGLDKYESGVFEVGCCKWKLVLYPNGNTKRNGKDHISLYLAMAEAADDILRGGQIDAIIKLFVYDHIRDKYLTIGDGRVKRFHALKMEHGFDQLLPIKTFTDSSNGYLVDDCCAFGTEIHVLKFEGEGEKFKIINDPENDSFTWKIDEFTLKSTLLSSLAFSVAGYKWKLELYPKGDSKGKDKSLAIFLGLDDNSDRSVPRLYAEYKVLVKDQVNGKHREYTSNNWFSGSGTSWGWSSFMLLTDLHNPSNGFLVNDTVIVEAQISRVAAAEFHPSKYQRTK